MGPVHHLCPPGDAAHAVSYTHLVRAGFLRARILEDGPTRLERDLEAANAPWVAAAEEAWWSTDPEICLLYTSVDGKEVWRTSDGGICEEPLYIKLSDEIGTWAGDIKEADLPDPFYVDYVRVYDLTEE